MSMTPLISIKETAEVLGVSVDSVRRWIASGRIDAVRVGPRLIKVRAESIEQFAQPIGVR